MIPVAPLIAFGKAALGVLAKVPWWVWAIAGAALALWLYTGYVDRRGRADERVKVNAEWEKRSAAAEARFAAAMDRKRGEVSDLVLAGIAIKDSHARELRDRELEHEVRFEELRKRRPSYVTEKAVAGCTLTRGVVLQFNSGAARANGAPDPAPAAEPAPGLVDEPAGIALDRYTGAVEDTQSALGTCRGQVQGWQRHWVDVTAWYSSLARILDACFPKGATP